MLSTAIILFLIAATFGLIILTAILKNKPTPKAAVFAHGPIAATALILVILYYLNDHADHLLKISIVIFILAALGGLTMFTLDVIKKKPVPKLIAVIHPIAAVTALIILILYVLQQ